MSAPPSKKPGLSLYADLLEPDKQKQQGATITGAPVKYDVKKGGGEDDAQKKKDASLKFQPIKRPQVQQKAKPKPTSSSSVHKFSSSTVTASASSPDKQLPSSTPQQQPSVQKSNFEDWVGDEDEYYQQDRPKHERGGRKKKKKNKPQERVWDWDDIYDPTLPNNYADYKGSEEQTREIRDWKARLYYHELKKAKKFGKNGATYSDDEEESRPRPMNSMFAPPSNVNFAPPSFDNDARPPPVDDDDDDYLPDAPSANTREQSASHEPSVSFAQSSLPDDPTGEDAYMRRMRLSGMVPEQEQPPPPPPPPTQQETVPMTTPPVARKPEPDVDMEAKRAEAQAKIAAFKAKLQNKASKPESSPAPAPPAAQETPVPPNTLAPSASPAAQPMPTVLPPPPPTEQSGATISRAPVRYQPRPAPSDMPTNEDTALEEPTEDQDGASAAEQPKSSRPGQKGFAERLLEKYGWEKGQGLGAQGEGITTAIVAKAEKRKRLPDAQGGGWAVPANMGKLVGGKKRKLDGDAEADPRLGKMSDVIKLEGMLDGLDVQHEIEENNLMQEVGDEMGSKYGNVERVFVWREEMGGTNDVFVKFTSQLSALRAVNATDGMTFAGNEVVARFWDSDKFESGQYS